MLRAEHLGPGRGAWWRRSLHESDFLRPGFLNHAVQERFDQEHIQDSDYIQETWRTFVKIINQW